MSRSEESAVEMDTDETKVNGYGLIHGLLRSNETRWYDNCLADLVSAMATECLCKGSRRIVSDYVSAM